VTKYRKTNLVAVAALPEYLGTLHRMVRRIGIHFIIEVVEHSGETPFVFVFAKPPGICPHNRFHREGVLAQGFTPGVLAEQIPSVFSRRHKAIKID
jgi:hypothetical protein